MRDPETRGEWLEAALTAEVLLRTDSARKYGFITGGPDVDLTRCEEILRRAREEHDIACTEAEIVAAIPAVLQEAG
jgi:hypothetical protein